MATFNMKSWENVPATQKVQHTFQNCKGRFKAVLSLFPVKSTHFLGHAHPDCSFQLTTQLRLASTSKDDTKKLQ